VQQNTAFRIYYLPAAGNTAFKEFSLSALCVLYGYFSRK